MSGFLLLNTELNYTLFHVVLDTIVAIFCLMSFTFRAISTSNILPSQWCEYGQLFIEVLCETFLVQNFVTQSVVEFEHNRKYWQQFKLGQIFCQLHQSVQGH
uniref:Uncharacterized protein n=1 Tax=Cacopsylla melanoneura TaxID=428564 RepID=A0A8D9DYZ1_9HEMI